MPFVHVLGIDKCQQAVSLARKNLAANTHALKIRQGDSIDFRHANILTDRAGRSGQSLGWQDTLDAYDVASHSRSDASSKQTQATSRTWDVLVSNPPYISPVQFRRTTTRSVRLFESKMALVPPSTEQTSTLNRAEPSIVQDEATADAFYPVLARIATATDVKVLLFEIGDAAQAARVAKQVRKTLGGVWDDLLVEIWRDDPSASSGHFGPRDKGHVTSEHGTGADTLHFPVRGRGNVRAVFACRVGAL